MAIKTGDLLKQRKGRTVRILGISVLFIIILTTIFFIWNQALEEPGVETSCMDLNGISSYTFDACFHLSSQTIFLTVRRNLYDNYDLSEVDASYFDTTERSYELSDLPEKGSYKVFYLDATKNPRNVYVTLHSKKVFTEPVCEVPRRLFVRDCSNQGPPGTVAGTSEVTPPSQEDLRNHLIELDQKEEAWKTKCISDWQCSEWEDCKGGLQNRKCIDITNCFIPTSVPNTVQYCSDSCVEQWKCIWSDCINEKTIPSCHDENKCETEYNKPTEVGCNFKEACEPDIQCSEWSECQIDYSLLSPQKETISTLPGIKSRVCEDQNKCVGTLKETSSCTVGVDIYTQTFNKCGKEYIDIYNKLDGSMVARVDTGDSKNPQVNIQLDGSNEEVYCDYCYNGKLDGDETNIDCGGSCGKCKSTSGPISLISETFLGKFANWLRNLFR